jgi:hypothetical protein
VSRSSSVYIVGFSVEELQLVTLIQPVLFFLPSATQSGLFRCQTLHSFGNIGKTWVGLEKFFTQIGQLVKSAKSNASSFKIDAEISSSHSSFLA